MDNWIIGNWKMNPDNTGAMALLDNLYGEFADFNNTVNVAICPPNLWAINAINKMQNSCIAIGAQTTSHLENGAHTGDLSASMLKSCGIELCIIGHSERRADHGESDEIIAQQIKALNTNSIKPVLCVGENLEQRKNKTHLEVVKNQLVNTVANGGALDNAIIAYEPIWAIGTGLLPSDDDIAEMHNAINDYLLSIGVNASILYGGSVKPDNASSLARIENVNGFLVGGASLDATGFAKIAKSFN